MRVHPLGWVAVLVLLLCACAPQLLTTPALSEETPLSTTRPTHTPSPAPQIGYPDKSTQPACLAAGGEVHEFRLASDQLSEPMPLRVYTPPCYHEETGLSYPVLYLIHGQTYAADQWDRLGADEAASRLIAAGEVAPFLIVMPQDSRHFAPPADNAFEGVFLADLIPWVEANYRVTPGREFRAVGGLSRGASWAIHLALNHPELFGALGGHSPPVFAEEAWKLRGLLDALAMGNPPRIWLDIGERDQQRILQSAQWFEDLLNERSIPHQWNLFTGDHSEAYWSSHVELYLRWYAAEW